MVRSIRLNVLQLIKQLQRTTDDNNIRTVHILDEQGTIYEPTLVEVEDDVAYIKVMEWE